MKALTIHQPWASLLAHGEKLYETRSWAPSETQLKPGDLLAIHACKGDSAAAYEMPEVIEALRHCGRLGEAVGRCWLPTGAVIAVTLYHYVAYSHEVAPPAGERALGDWSPGRYVWRLDPVHLFEEPITWPGRQRLWEWDLTEGARAELLAAGVDV